MLTSLKLLEFISNFFKNLQQLYLPNIIPDHMNFKKTHTLGLVLIFLRVL